jgi:RHS repeat-associated protein
VLLEKQGSNYTAVYTHGNAQVRKDSEYPLYDGIGSERTVTAANQSVSGTITFEGFGQTVATTGSSGNPYMFKGAWSYRNDGDSGLHHVGARYYDAQVGRFITRDTYLDQHPYLYCEHDPVNHADPSGHIFFLIVAGIGAYIAGKSAIRIIGNVQQVRTNREAEADMRQRLIEWRPQTENGLLLKDIAVSGGLRKWEIGASSKPGSAVAGDVAGIVIGLAGGFGSAVKGLKDMYPSK